MNPRQAAAVGYPVEGAVLVLAGAGSGKTTVLTRRVAFLRESHPQAGILALTFTKDAAHEMETRLRTLTSGTVSGSAFPSIGTFHSFAFGLIRADHAGAPNWFRLGFSSCPSLLDPAGLVSWLKTVKKESALDAPLERLQAWVENPFMDGGDAANAANAADGSDTAATADTQKDMRRETGAAGPVAVIQSLRERFRNHLLETGSVAFDDMVALAIRLLRQNPEVRESIRNRYRYILVDEFQDTSRDQLELVKLLVGEEPSLFLVGDDDQAIYGFRGADPGNIAAALEHFPGMGILKLETNYRSSAAIVAYANAVFRDKPADLRKRLEAGSSRGSAPVRNIVHADGVEQAAWMVGEMRRLRRDEGLDWGDVAVLFRLNALEPYYRSMLARLAGEEAAEKVILSTVHAAKGLEYPAVFFAGLEDGILPYHRGGETLAPDRLAEERRIFYVGVTRAQRFLYLCSSRSRILRGKRVQAAPSPFLKSPGGFRPAPWSGAAWGGKMIRKAREAVSAYRSVRGRKDGS